MITLHRSIGRDAFEILTPDMKTALQVAASFNDIERDVRLLAFMWSEPTSKVYVNSRHVETESGDEYDFYELVLDVQERPRIQLGTLKKPLVAGFPFFPGGFKNYEVARFAEEVPHPDEVRNFATSFFEGKISEWSVYREARKWDSESRARLFDLISRAKKKLRDA